MTTATVTPRITAEMVAKDAKLVHAYIAQLEADNAAKEAELIAEKQRASEQASFSVKIGRSGTVSVSGFGRYGISLYDSQWDALIPLCPAIKRFKTAYAEQIKARVDHPIADGEPNDFKPLKLKADSTFVTPTV